MRFKAIYLTLSLALTGIGITVFTGLAYNLQMPALTGDVFLVTRAPPVIGLLSNLTAFAWFGTAAILLMTAIVIKAHTTKLGPLLPYLVWSFALTLFLGMDDFFMVHDYWIRQWFGKQDLLFYGALAVLLLLYLGWFRREIKAVSPLTLALAFGFLGGSVAMDLVQEQMTAAIGHWQYLVEDGFKWVGCCFWFTHFLLVCSAFLTAPSVVAAGKPLDMAHVRNQER